MQRQPDVFKTFSSVVPWVEVVKFVSGLGPALAHLGRPAADSLPAKLRPHVRARCLHMTPKQVSSPLKQGPAFREFCDLEGAEEGSELL